MSKRVWRVGIQIELRKDHVIIVAPIAGGPSERAGIQRGDEIVSIGRSKTGTCDHGQHRRKTSEASQRPKLKLDSTVPSSNAI